MTETHDRIHCTNGKKSDPRIVEIAEHGVRDTR
jgi:hypothetical protein